MNKEALPSNPPRVPRHGDAIIWSPEQAAEIRAKIAEIERKKGVPATRPPETKRYGSPPSFESHQKQILINGLNQLLQDAEVDLHRENVARHKMKPGMATILPGYEPTQATTEEKATKDETILALSMRRDALQEALNAAQTGEKLPADAGVIIDKIAAEVTKQLNNVSERATNGLATPDQVEYFRKRLGMIQRLRARIQ